MSVEYIRRKLLVDFILEKASELGQARITNQDGDIGLARISGSEQTLKEIHNLILDETAIITGTPRRGEWIPNGRDTAHTIYYRCSRCAHEIAFPEDCDRTLPRYCEECASDNRKRSD